MRRVVWLMALFLLAGCGSTVRLDSLGSSSSPAAGVANALAPDQPAAADAPGLAPRSPSSTAPDAPVTADTPAVSAPSSAGVVAVSGPGVTATTISIGVMYKANADKANAAAGGSAITSGDPRAEAQYVIDDINAHGGVAGRKLVPIYYAYNAQSGQGYATQDQAACEFLTHDHHVFAIMGSGLTTDFDVCAEKGGASVIGGNIVRYDQLDFARHPHSYDIQGFSVDHLVTSLASTLRANDYFGGWDERTGKPSKTAPTVGILTFDSRELTAGTKRLISLLARDGVQVKSNNITYLSNPSGPGDLASDSTAVQSAVVRMRGNGVDHLIVLDTSGGMSQLLLTFAQYQTYFPRYAVGSGSGIEAYLESNLVPKQQLAGMVGMGWMPMLDLPLSANPDNGPYSSDARRHCTAVMAAKGVSFTSSNARSIAYLVCDQIGLLVQGARAVTGALTPASLLTAIEGLGSRLTSASLGVARMGAGKHDAVARTFAWVYSPSCGCMTYVGRGSSVA